MSMVWSEILRLTLIFMYCCSYLSIGCDFYVLALILEVALDFYSLVMISMSLPGILRLVLDVFGSVRVSTCCGNKENAYSRKCFKFFRASAS